MHRRLLSLGAAVAAALVLVATPAYATSGDADPTPHPDWSLSGKTHHGKPGSVTPDLTVWACKGHADVPGLVQDAQWRNYVAYSAYQDCTGEFLTQKVCIRLQRRDYFGNFDDVTTTTCSVETVDTRAYKGASVLCSLAGHGIYRTAAYGVAYPDGVAERSSTAYSYSSSALC